MLWAFQQSIVDMFFGINYIDLMVYLLDRQEFRGIPLTKSVIISSQLLQSWEIFSSLRTTSWLRAALRCSKRLSVSMLGGV